MRSMSMPSESANLKMSSLRSLRVAGSSDVPRASSLGVRRREKAWQRWCELAGGSRLREGVEEAVATVREQPHLPYIGTRK